MKNDEVQKFSAPAPPPVVLRHLGHNRSKTVAEPEQTHSFEVLQFRNLEALPLRILEALKL